MKIAKEGKKHFLPSNEFLIGRNEFDKDYCNQMPDSAFYATISSDHCRRKTINTTIYRLPSFKHRYKPNQYYSIEEEGTYCVLDTPISNPKWDLNINFGCHLLLNMDHGLFESKDGCVRIVRSDGRFRTTDFKLKSDENIAESGIVLLTPKEEYDNSLWLYMFVPEDIDEEKNLDLIKIYEEEEEGEIELFRCINATCVLAAVTRGDVKVLQLINNKGETYDVTNLLSNIETLDEFILLELSAEVLSVFFWSSNKGYKYTKCGGCETWKGEGNFYQLFSLYMRTVDYKMGFKDAPVLYGHDFKTKYVGEIAFYDPSVILFRLDRNFSSVELFNNGWIRFRRNDNPLVYINIDLNMAINVNLRESQSVPLTTPIFCEKNNSFAIYVQYEEYLYRVRWDLDASDIPEVEKSMPKAHYLIGIALGKPLQIVDENDGFVLYLGSHRLCVLPSDAVDSWSCGEDSIIVNLDETIIFIQFNLGNDEIAVKQMFDRSVNNWEDETERYQICPFYYNESSQLVVVTKNNNVDYTVSQQIGLVNWERAEFIDWGDIHRWNLSSDEKVGSKFVRFINGNTVLCEHLILTFKGDDFLDVVLKFSLENYSAVNQHNTMYKYDANIHERVICQNSTLSFDKWIFKNSELRKKKHRRKLPMKLFLNNAVIHCLRVPVFEEYDAVQQDKCALL
ncbi:hypothetical protein PCE1_000614 [Barthelona sp. PCE]